MSYDAYIESMRSEGLLDERPECWCDVPNGSCPPDGCLKRPANPVYPYDHAED